MQENKLNSAKMREQPIGRLLLKMSLPAMLSMLVQALYNVVDTVFVSGYDPEYGLTALSVVFPLQMLLTAFAVGTGVGINVQIAKKLGENKHAEANNVAQTGLLASIGLSLIFVVLGLTVVRPFISAYSDTPAVNDMGASYLTIVMCLGQGMFVEIACSKTLQATGNMTVPMISQLIGALTNIILDPLFIFDWGLGMGIKGAAIATVIGQFAAMTFVLIVMFVKKHDVSISLKNFKFRARTLGEIFVIGLPTIVMNAITSVTISVLNLVIKGYNGAIAILGAYFKLQSFVFMPVFGLTQGALPILSYNYGYGNKKRYDRTFKLATLVSFGIMVLGFAIFQALPALLLKAFSLETTYMAAGCFALRIISISFLPAAVSIVITTALQSLGKGVWALAMSLLRQLVFLIPFALILSALYGQKGVWFCYPASEFLVMIIFLPLIFRFVKKAFKGKPVSELPIEAEAEAEAKAL